MSTSDAKFGETAEVGVLQHLADVTGAPFFCELCDSPLEDEHVIICSLHVYVCVYIIIYMYIYICIYAIYIYIVCVHVYMMHIAYTCYSLVPWTNVYI